MFEPTQTDLDKAAGALRDAHISESSLRRALDRAKQIEDAAVERRDAGRLVASRDRSGRRLPVRTAVAIFATTAVVLLALWMVDWSGQTVYGQLPRVLTDIERVHLVIHSPARPGQAQEHGVEIWFQRGAGFAMHGPLGMEIDDGETYWNYYRSRKLAIRSQSRMGEGRFTDIQQLGKIVGFHVDELPRSLDRLPEEDQSVDGTPCLAYAWLQESLGPISGNLKAIEEMWPGRRLIFLLDETNRLRSWRHQRGLSDRWKTYRTIDVDYPEQIAKDRFAPQFGDDVKVVDAGSSELSIDPQVAILVDGLRRRHASLRDIEFRFNVTADVKRSSESQFQGVPESGTYGQRKTRETLAIMSPLPERSDRPWRRWVHTQPGESDTNRLLRFAAFDGEQSRLYKAGMQGLVVADEMWHWFANDWFEQLLFLGINGISSITPMSEEVRELHLNRMHILDRHKSGELEIVTILGGSSAEFGMEYHIEMTAEPDFMVLRWEARYARRNNQLVSRYAVTEFGEFDGIRYPAKGSYRQTAVRELSDITYEFEVTGCDRLDKDDREDWFPSWPSGTLVRDQVLGENHVAE